EQDPHGVDLLLDGPDPRGDVHVDGFAVGDETGRERRPPVVRRAAERLAREHNPSLPRLYHHRLMAGGVARRRGDADSLSDVGLALVYLEPHALEVDDVGVRVLPVARRVDLGTLGEDRPAGEVWVA